MKNDEFLIAEAATGRDFAVSNCHVEHFPIASINMGYCHYCHFCQLPITIKTTKNTIFTPFSRFF